MATAPAERGYCSTRSSAWFSSSRLNAPSMRVETGRRSRSRIATARLAQVGRLRTARPRALVRVVVVPDLHVDISGVVWALVLDLLRRHRPPGRRRASDTRPASRTGARWASCPRRRRRSTSCIVSGGTRVSMSVMSPTSSTVGVWITGALSPTPGIRSVALATTLGPRGWQRGLAVRACQRRQRFATRRAARS